MVNILRYEVRFAEKFENLAIFDDSNKNVKSTYVKNLSSQLENQVKYGFPVRSGEGCWVHCIFDFLQFSFLLAFFQIPGVDDGELQAEKFIVSELVMKILTAANDEARTAGSAEFVALVKSSGVAALTLHGGSNLPYQGSSPWAQGPNWMWEGRVSIFLN